MSKVVDFIIIVSLVVCAVGFEDYWLFHNFDDERTPIILFMIGVICAFVGFWVYIHSLALLLSPVVC